jgi:hypothetical protein
MAAVAGNRKTGYSLGRPIPLRSGLRPQRRSASRMGAILDVFTAAWLSQGEEFD